MYENRLVLRLILFSNGYFKKGRGKFIRDVLQVASTVVPATKNPYLPQIFIPSYLVH